MPSQEALLKIIDVHSEVAQLGLDLPGVMSLVVNRTLELVDADAAVIELAEGEDLVYRAVAGMAQSQLGARVRRNGSLSGTSLELTQPLICEDAEADPRVDLDACRRVGVRSMVVIPLMHLGETVGVLKASSGLPGRFSEEDARTLGMLSKLVAAAMYWATRYGKDDLFHRATHDELTGLANRALFMDRLRHAVAQVGRLAPPVAVLLVDMDGLKQINDKLGHAVGDAALIELARRLNSAARDTDTVARLGGDEFGVVLAPMSTASALQAVIERYQALIDLPAIVDGHTLILRASIGGALCPLEACEAPVLVELADQRMYEAKRRRKAADGLPETVSDPVTLG